MTLLHARLCAVVTAASCVVHLGLAWANHHGIWVSAAMTVMVAVCLPCSVHLWRRSEWHLQARVLHRIMASATAMAFLHAALVLGVPSGGHAHGVSAAGASASTTAAEAWAAAASSNALFTLGIIAAELATALLAATLVARLRVVRTSRRTPCPFSAPVHRGLPCP